MRHLGYACINQNFSNLPKSKRITTNRSMIRRTFDEKGLPYVSELVLQNVQDLYKIINWNEENGIKFYRMSSDTFPWASEYHLEQLPDFDKILFWLQKCGTFATKFGHRLTYHPGPFNKLCSPDERVVNNTLKDLNHHGEVMDLMGLSMTPYNKINIHVGAAYDCKKTTGERFCKNFDLLNDSTKARLTIENDDKASMWSAIEIYEQIYSVIGTPIVFDYHHYQFCTGGQTEEEALITSTCTWGDIVPVVHFSQSRSIEHNDSKIKPQAHSDSYWDVPNFYDQTVDVMLECKHKEIGLFKMRQLLKG